MFDQMMQPTEQVDDEEAALGALASYHARDIPEDWAEANPYLVDQGVPAGEGYEGEFDMGAAFGALGVDEQGFGAADEMREALSQQSQQQLDSSQTMQDSTQEQNAQIMDQRKQLTGGY